jgi:hypothetical protein
MARAGASELDGLGSQAIASGPDLYNDPSSTTTAFQQYNPGSGLYSIIVIVRHGDGSINTSECPDSFGVVAAPPAATELSNPALSGTWMFVTANIGTAAQPDWELFAAQHFYGPGCAGWQPWTQVARPSGVTWTSAPSAVTVPDGRTFVFVVADVHQLYYFEIKRVIRWPGGFGWSFAPWNYYNYWTYPQVTVSAPLAPTATVVNGQISVVLSSALYPYLWQRTTSLGTFGGDVSWYEADDCNVGGGYGYRYGNAPQPTPAGGVATVGDADTNDLRVAYGDANRNVQIQRPDWTAGCAGHQFPPWAPIMSGYQYQSRPTLAFTSSANGSTHFALLINAWERVNFNWVQVLLEASFDGTNWPPAVHALTQP